MDIVQAEGCFQRRKQSKQREPRKRSNEGNAQEKEVEFGVDALPCHYFDSRRSIGVWRARLARAAAARSWWDLGASGKAVKGKALDGPFGDGGGRCAPKFLGVWDIWAGWRERSLRGLEELRSQGMRNLLSSAVALLDESLGTYGVIGSALLRAARPGDLRRLRSPPQQLPSAAALVRVS